MGVNGLSTVTPCNTLHSQTLSTLAVLSLAWFLLFFWRISSVGASPLCFADGVSQIGDGDGGECGSVQGGGRSRRQTRVASFTLNDAARTLVSKKDGEAWFCFCVLRLLSVCVRTVSGVREGEGSGGMVPRCWKGVAVMGGIVTREAAGRLESGSRSGE